MPERQMVNQKSDYYPPQFKVKSNLKAGILCSDLQSLYFRDLVSRPTLASRWESEMRQRRCEVGAAQFP